MMVVGLSGEINLVYCNKRDLKKFIVKIKFGKVNLFEC